MTHSIQYSCQLSKHLLSLWNKTGLHLYKYYFQVVGLRKLIGLGFFFLKYQSQRKIMYSMAIFKHCSYFGRTCSAVAIEPSRSAHNTRLWSDVWSALLLSCQEGDNYTYSLQTWCIKWWQSRPMKFEFIFANLYVPFTLLKIVIVAERKCKYHRLLFLCWKCDI